MTNPMTVDMIKPRSSPPNNAPIMDPMFFLGDSEFDSDILSLYKRLFKRKTKRPFNYIKKGKTIRI